MAYPTGTNFPPQFPQIPQPSPFSAATLGGMNRPVGLPPAGGGFGLPPGGFGQPQDAFAQQAAAAVPQPGAAPPTAGPDGAEGFGDKNLSLSTGGWASKVYSWQGLATGIAIAGSIIGGHKLIADKWFPWSTVENGAKEGIDTLTQTLKDEISAGKKGLVDQFDKFRKALGIGTVDQAKLDEASKIVKDDLSKFNKLNESNLGAHQEVYTNFTKFFETPAVGSEITAEADKATRDAFVQANKAFEDKIAPELKAAVVAGAKPAGGQVTEAAAAAGETPTVGQVTEAAAAEKFFDADEGKPDLAPTIPAPIPSKPEPTRGSSWNPFNYFRK